MEWKRYVMKKKALSAIVFATLIVISEVAFTGFSIFREEVAETITLQKCAVPAGEVALNETNFPDANFLSFVSKYDKDKSGGLSASEIKSVTEIGCSDMNISDLKGIEYFTSLRWLDCTFNQLTSLDVRSNTQLITLYCAFNQLTLLDVSKNLSLKSLNCDWNALSSLDVSRNLSLEGLTCSFNDLTTLNVSKNTELEWLNCGCNELTNLDLSKNSELDGLSCYRNQLTSLDVTRNKKLTYLACEGNQIKKLDIHLCPKLLELITKETRKEEKTDFFDSYYYGSSQDDDYFGYDKSVTLITKGPSVGKVTGLKAVSAGRNKVKLTWNAVDGAVGYLVYAQKDKKYGYVGMTTQGTTFTDTKALDTDYNYYWVFAYVKDVDGSMIPGGCEKYVYAKGVCLAVTNLKASSGTGYVKLTWTASAGADGYLVYGIRPGGTYGYIGMTTRGTTFTDTKASKEDYTFYWVFPYHKDASGNMIVGGTAKYTYGKAR